MPGATHTDHDHILDCLCHVCDGEPLDSFRREEGSEFICKLCLFWRAEGEIL